MFNSITAARIMMAPAVAGIDPRRLPQELTRIYAQIVSLRQGIRQNELGFETGEFSESILMLRSLAFNLEAFVLLHPTSDHKEAAAFVAATAHLLLHRIRVLGEPVAQVQLTLDTIPSLVSALVLFLIGNSQADACEIATKITTVDGASSVQRRLLSSLVAFAKGDLALPQLDRAFHIDYSDLQAAAVDSLWMELTHAVEQMMAQLSRKRSRSETDYIGNVLSLAVSEFTQIRSVFNGPYHLAKLLSQLRDDLSSRAVVSIPSPQRVDSEQWDEFLQQLATVRPFLWENHVTAIDNGLLTPGVSSVITLPTGAGKSTLSELKIASCLLRGNSVIYLVPTHALEEQVVGNLKKTFQNLSFTYFEIGAEFTEEGYSDDKKVRVMTPERCLTLLSMHPEICDDLGLVVFDEFHLIHSTQTAERRPMDAMLCLLSLLDICPDADYLLISAMVANGAEICDWLALNTGRRCVLFNSAWKPTRQLHGCLVYEGREINNLLGLVSNSRRAGDTKFPGAELKRNLIATPYCFFSLRNTWTTEDSSDYYTSQLTNRNVPLTATPDWRLSANRNKVAAQLALHYANLGMKVLVFAANPKFAVSIVTEVNRTNPDSGRFRKLIENGSKELISLSIELGSIDYSYLHDAHTAVAHHGALLPLERSIIEEYFKSMEGVPVIVATATLAQGINLPAEIVIIAGDDRYDDEHGGMEAIDPHELLNAAGRAGRAGQSSQGAVIVIPGEIVTIQDNRISPRWWKLREEVFSKPDQCLLVSDPLEALLDALQDDSIPLTRDQLNILYRFKKDNIDESQIKRMFGKSLGYYQSFLREGVNAYYSKLDNLIEKRASLDEVSEELEWIQNICFKSGIEPGIILALHESVAATGFEEIFQFGVRDCIAWYFNWLESNAHLLGGLFNKRGSVERILSYDYRNGVPAETQAPLQLTKLRTAIELYINGAPLIDIEHALVNRTPSQHLGAARLFVIKTIPDLSFAFGILSLVIIESASIAGIQRKQVPLEIRSLATYIREGFDIPQKLTFKLGGNILSRVETHRRYNEA